MLRRFLSWVVGPCGRREAGVRVAAYLAREVDLNGLDADVLGADSHGGAVFW